MTYEIIEWAARHPTEFLLWSHGFAWALALRRGRIERLISRIIPDRRDDGDE